jgi:biotin operon repressor
MSRTEIRKRILALLDCGCDEIIDEIYKLARDVMQNEEEKE